MAKNLKLQIKNKQLAAALTKKKKPTDDAKAKQEEERKKAASEGAFVPKAKKLKLIQPGAAEEKVEKEIQEEELKTPEEAPKKQEPSSPPAEEKSPLPEEKSAEPTPASKSPKAATEAKAQGASSKPVEHKRPPAKSDKVSPHAKQYDRNAKENKSTKKQAFQRAFDSRDKQGLRANDEGTWARRRNHRPKQRKVAAEDIIRPKEIEVSLPITVKNLASEMKYKASEVIAKLFTHGITLRVNDYIDDETTVEFIGDELGCKITIGASEEQQLQLAEMSLEEEIKASPEKDLSLRPPVIAFMGHVDHGKTSLIDFIRKSNVASGESGAITQHIGAFTTQTEHGEVTILDTPGHEAFSAIRQRGAKATDIVVLVVAGDDGIKQQTEEAIAEAQAANVPMVFALNKCDKAGFDAEMIYRQLAEKELLPEAWGGSVVTINCSATTGEGIPELLEMLALQSEILELKVNENTRARGIVLESRLMKGLGATATLLIQNGTLKQGDALAFDDVYGRAKTMQDEHGLRRKTAIPGHAVIVSGLRDVPTAGSEFIAVKNEKQARQIYEDRVNLELQIQSRQKKALDVEKILNRQSELQDKKIFNVLLKADVQGSLEAIRTSLLKIPTDKVEINIISEQVGAINESDIEMASVSNAVIYGFHTTTESHAEALIKELKVEIKHFDIIYHLIDDAKEHMRSLLDKIRQENEVGTAEVRATFKSSQHGVIAGCQVTDGIIKRSHLAKLFRDDELIWEGNFASLKRVKEDVKEVPKGIECGILLEKFDAIQEGDLIKAYEITYHEQEL